MWRAERFAHLLYRSANLQSLPDPYDGVFPHEFLDEYYDALRTIILQNKTLFPVLVDAVYGENKSWDELDATVSSIVGNEHLPPIPNEIIIYRGKRSKYISTLHIPNSSYATRQSYLSTPIVKRDSKVANWKTELSTGMSWTTNERIAMQFAKRVSRRDKRSQVIFDTRIPGGSKVLLLSLVLFLGFDDDFVAQYDNDDDIHKSREFYGEYVYDNEFACTWRGTELRSQAEIVTPYTTLTFTPLRQTTDDNFLRISGTLRSDKAE